MVFLNPFSTEMTLQTVLLFILCLEYPILSHQQAWSERKNYGDKSENERASRHYDFSDWKPIAIIGTMLILFLAITYGTNCFYICKWHFCEKHEKHYTKMDSYSTA